MDENFVENLGDKYKLVRVPDSWEITKPGMIRPFFRYYRGIIVGVVENTPTDYIVPYFDTRFYINLDSMNLICYGAKGCVNFVILNLETWCEEHGASFSRNAILYALEQFCFNRPAAFEMGDIFKVNDGSIISMSINGGSSNSMLDVLYTKIVDLEYQLKTEIPSLFDGVGLHPVTNRVANILAILRSAELDYSVYACLGKPSLLNSVIEKLGIHLGGRERVLLYSYLKNDKMAIIEDLACVRNFDFKQGYYQMADSFIDLERITNRIKGVLNREGR